MMSRWYWHIMTAMSIILVGLSTGGLVWTFYYHAPLVELNPSQPVKGIDVSSHNGYIDFEAVRRDGVDFAIMKVTEGATFKDSTFLDNYRRASAAGMKVGAYHFFRFETRGEMQAINMMHSVRGMRLDMPLIIDVEEWGNPHSDISTGEIVERLSAMINFLEDAGYGVMLYTNRDGYKRFIDSRFERYPLWICSFTDPPMGEAAPHNLVLWQFSHRGSVKGVNGRVDRNAFLGERKDFDSWIKSLQSTVQY